MVKLPPMETLAHLAILAFTILLLARFVPGVRVDSIGTAAVVAVVFSVLNFFLGWLLAAALFVPALFTLGLLFLFVPFIVNTVLLWLTDKLIASFEIRTMGSLLLASAIITIVNGLFSFSYVHSAWTGYGTGHTRWI
jgi:putative membrane protein